MARGPRRTRRTAVGLAVGVATVSVLALDVDTGVADAGSESTYDAEVVCVSSGPDYGSWQFRNLADQAVTTSGNLGTLTLAPGEAAGAHTRLRLGIFYPRSPDYPRGMCDTMTPGLPTLLRPAAQRPTATRTIGRSVLGRPIIAEYWGPADAATKVIVIGQVHGNECSVTLLTSAIRSSPPTNIGVWLIPTLNPDGYARGTRGNANGVDLNADGGYLTQPESRALMTFTASVGPELTIHAHSPNGTVEWFGPQPATTLTNRIAAATGLTPTDAGGRADRSRWFLWQGQHVVHVHPVVLVELLAVHDSEVPTATPRPPTNTVGVVARQARTVCSVVTQMQWG